MLTQKIKNNFTVIMVALSLVGFLTVVIVPDVGASTAGNIQDGVDRVTTGNTAGTSLESIIRIVINTLLFLIGIVAVVMIIMGGFRYIVSNGDTGAMTAAKNTILYAVVGLVVAIAAFAIVNFVLDAFL